MSEYIVESSDTTVFEDKELERNLVGNYIEHLWTGVGSLRPHYERILRPVMLLLWHSYLIAVWLNNNQTCLHLCEDVGLLLLLTALVDLGLAYFFIIKPLYRKLIKTDEAARLIKSVIHPVQRRISGLMGLPYSNTVVSLLFLLSLAIFLLVDTAEDPSRLVSAAGILVLVLLGLIFSKHPGYVVWRPVLWGLGLQFCLGLVILRWELGKAVFDCLGRKVKRLLDFTEAGSGFVFGYLVTLQPFNPAALNLTTSRAVAEDINNSQSLGFIFFFKVLSIIYFFNFLASILHYLGTLAWLVSRLGWVLEVSLTTTACESLSTAANIFLGQTEAPLLIKPYLGLLTKSELHAVMTGGFATIAGSVMAAYISLGVSPSHLLSASVMSAPAALAFSKLIYPETKQSKTTAGCLPRLENKSANVLDAAVQGATESVVLVGSIAASLVSSLAFMACLTSLLGWLGGLLSLPGLSLEGGLGWLFYPLALLMGVPCGAREEEQQEDECQLVGVLLGLKTVLNEFVAYDRLVKLKPFLSPRSAAISTYALCGFSNPAALGIQITVLGYLAPHRRANIAQVATSAFVAGSAASFLTACVAATLIRDEQ